MIRRNSILISTKMKEKFIQKLRVYLDNKKNKFHFYLFSV